MNYRHSYHAGNFADVLKHVVLLSLIENLKQKDKPFCYIDTHAGSGVYDLLGEDAQKTQEAELGVMKLMQQPLPECLSTYGQLLKQCNQALGSDSLRFYPGSPYLVRQLLREDDRMVLTELHEATLEGLKAVFYRDKQVALHHLDAYLGLKALLPPMPRRGLVLIDPPYEQPDEFRQLFEGLKQALRRWETGIYAIWYPIKDRLEVTRFLAQCKTLAKPMLNVSLQPVADDFAFGLKASGMLIINPPWQFDAVLAKQVEALWQLLSPQRLGHYKIESLL